MRQKTVPEQTQSDWRNLWRTKSHSGRIECRYQLAVAAAELASKNDALASDVVAKLKDICKSSSVAVRVLRVGENVKLSSVDLMLKHSSGRKPRGSWTHLVVTRDLSERDRLAYLQRCVDEGIGTGKLQEIISEDYETVQGGRSEVRVTELSRQLNHALGQAVIAAGRFSNADVATAVSNVKKRDRRKAIEELSSIIFRIKALDKVITSVQPPVAEAMSKLELLEKS